MVGDISRKLGTTICNSTPMFRVGQSGKYGLWLITGRLCFVLGSLEGMKCKVWCDFSGFCELLDVEYRLFVRSSISLAETFLRFRHMVWVPGQDGICLLVCMVLCRSLHSMWPTIVVLALVLARGIIGG